MAGNLETGQRIKFRYEITEIIHSDERGAIYQVNDDRGIKRAIKEIVPPPGLSEEAGRQFSEKVEQLKKLSHTNLVKIEDYFTENSRYYIVMNLVKGKSLEGLINEKYRNTPPPLKLFMNYMVKVCGVIKYLHQRKPKPVFFGFLRPSNILITGSSQIKLFNYGMSNILFTGSDKGVPGFCSPEHCRDGNLNVKSDIFSLGATVYYILTGDNPENNPMDFKNIREINPEVTPSLENIVLLCLKEDPRERPAIEDLSSILVKAYIASTIPVPSLPDLEEIKSGVMGKDDYDEDFKAEPVVLPAKDRRKEAMARSIMTGIREKQDKQDINIPTGDDIELAPFETEDEVPLISDEMLTEDTIIPEEEGPPPEAEFEESRPKEDVFFELIIEPEKEAPEDVKRQTPSETIKEVFERPKEPASPEEDRKTPPYSDKYDYKASEKPFVSEHEKNIAVKSASKSAFSKIKDTSGIAAFLRAKSMEEKGESSEEKVPLVSIDDALDFSNVAPYRDPASLPPLALYEEIDMLKDNRYEVEELIHKDCYGAIYVVRDYDEEDEALEAKLLREIQYKDPHNDMNKVREVANKFIKRASLLKKCRHPNLFQVMDYFVDFSEEDFAVRLFLVTEYPAGLNFKEVLETYKMSEKHMAATSLFSLIPKICNALDYLHSQKPEPVFTGEIKPEDLILCNDGEVKLANYGLAGIFTGVSQEANPLRGTPGYSAPERIKTGVLNAKTDVFSLGVIIYYMLTSIDLSEKPYDFPPIRKLNPFLSHKVARFISLCISLNPEERPVPEQLKRSIELIDFFEIDRSSVKKAEEIQEEDKAKTRRIPPAPSKANLLASKIKNILSNKIVFGVTVLIVFVFLWQFLISLLPEKEKFPFLLYAIDKRVLVKLDLKTSAPSSENLDKPLMGIAYSEKKGCLYGINPSDETLAVLKPDSDKVKNRMTLDISPSSVTLSLDENTAYVTNTGSNKISVVDLNKFKDIVPPVRVESGPVNSILSYDGNILCILHNQKFLTLIDTRENKVIASANLNYIPPSVAFGKDSQKIYVAGFPDNEIPVLNGKLREIKKLPVDAFVVDIVSDSDGNLYALTEKSETLRELLVISNDIIKKNLPLEFRPLKIVNSEKEKKLFILGQTVVGTTYLICEYEKDTGKIKIMLQLRELPIMLLPVYI